MATRMRTKEGRELMKLVDEIIADVKHNLAHREGWKVFDWQTAAKFLNERDPEVAYAYLK